MITPFDSIASDVFSVALQGRLRPQATPQKDG